ncbi:hypothetical protein [Xanthomarina sp. F2636L]|uniref:hypothetical protein n=1 Tax=Xanthomarina sp. F2636L TaxID=2996018 RepID=UPI00225E1DEE|nr:hypothetical protein [Xanthomarina sp. F2636L]MCX7552159.1 hypothetical protein [Xanthomarina sp. F2636L]
MKANLLSMLLLLVTLSISSQENFSEQTKTFLDENAYLNNVEKEKFYLHTNKTTYYAGEKIWFKAYIVEDSNNKPNLNTTNIFVNFYSPEKKLISSQLYYAEAGFTYGEMEIHPDLISGTYYMDIDTNKNRNFKSGSVISIQVLSTSKTSENTLADIKTKNSTETNVESNYTMAFYPESQTVLKDEINNIAFTIKNNQVPVKASGKIIDNTSGETITRFMSDIYGMGRFSLLYNGSFSAVINVDGIDEKFPLPEANPLGFIIQKKLDFKNENTTSFLLKTNNATSSKYRNESVVLVLHRNGFAKSVAPIEINKEATSYQINFLNKDLFSGINTLTLFDKTNKPISEYSFWNEPENIELEVTQFQASSDSITLDFRMLNKLADANLSVSVLPAATISYNNQQNIITEFQLAPYLNDTGFNLANYYNKTNGNKHSMDLLIQTGKKNNQIQRNITSENDLVFQPEHGVKIRGSVNSKDKDLSKHKVMLSSTENNILSIKPLKGERQFEFDSLKLVHPSKYKLALLNKKGEIVKANFYIYNNFNKYRPDSLLTKPTEEYSKTTFETVYTLEDEYVPQLMEEEILDEILIKAKVKARENKEILEDRILAKVRNVGFTRIHIPDEKSYVGASVVFYLRTLPSIFVVQDSRSVTIMSTRGPGAGAFMKDENNNSGKQLGYYILLDEIPISDHSELLYMQMFDIAAVTVNANGSIINIYSKTYELMKGLGTMVNSDIQISETEFGFSLPKETFKNSEIYFPNQTSEELYSTIDWIPNFYLNSKTPNYLTISTKKHQKLKLFINGMNANSQLVYKSVTIEQESN